MELTKEFLGEKLETLKSNITEQLSEKDAKLQKEFDGKIEALKKELDTSESLKSIEEKIEAEKKRIDKLAEKKKETGSNTRSFAKSFAENFKENYDSLKDIASKGGTRTLNLKDATINSNNDLVGATSTANEAGGALINQLNQGVILPSQLVNFDELVTTISGTEDTLRYWREVSQANNVGTPASKGAVKPELDFQFDPQTETADYTAGVYRFHKSMFRNLPWMQQRLPQMMRRDFYKKQNADYYAKLIAEATAYSGSAADIEAIVEAVGQLESSDFPVNGVVLNPSDWARLSLTKDDSNGYTLPSTVNFVNGQLTINGVPVFKATWVDEDSAVVGDWTQAYKYVTDGLNIQFSEEDSDNFQKNAISSRVEESNVLVVEQPEAFIKIPNLDGVV